MLISTSKGTTARSWHNRIANADCPNGVPSSRRWISSCMMIAVDEKASTTPRMTEASMPLPKRAASRPIAAAVNTTCKPPRPNTSRRMDHRRCIDMSSPIMNMRKITPSSARNSTSSGRAKVSHDSHGHCTANAASPYGPISVPKARKPSTGLMRKRASSGMSTPASARNRMISLRSGTGLWASIGKGKKEAVGGL